MKTNKFNDLKRRLLGLTLVEMTVAMSLFSLVLIGVLSLQLFALRQDQIVESKLGASDHVRTSFQKLVWEMRGANSWDLGFATPAGVYTPITNNVAQRGSAIRFWTTTPPTNYIQYFFVTNSGSLWRLTQADSVPRLIVRGLTNNMYFQAEDYLGNIQTNDLRLWRSTLRVKMEFFDYHYPYTVVGPGALYDYYKVEYKVAPYCPAGVAGG